MKQKEIIAYLWGDDHYEDSLEEMIEYMEFCDLSKDEIVGIEIELCEKANVYLEEDYIKIQDIIYGESEIYDDDYFQNTRDEIMKLIESVKYYSPFKKYTITEEDYEEVIKDM